MFKLRSKSKFYIMKEILIFGAILIGYFYFFSKKTETPSQEETKEDEKPRLKIRKKNA